MVLHRNQILRSPLRDDVGGGGGGGSSTSPKLATAPMIEPNGMPSELREQMDTYKRWADDDRRDARRDTFAFWSLKVPAIAVSAGASAFAYFKLDAVAVIAGAVASACVLIDGLNPRGTLRNIHRRAYNEISTLHAGMAAKWREGILRKMDPRQLGAEIIAGATADTARISAYITAAESSLSGRLPHS